MAMQSGILRMTYSSAAAVQEKHFFARGELFNAKGIRRKDGKGRRFLKLFIAPSRLLPFALNSASAKVLDYATLWRFCLFVRSLASHVPAPYVQWIMTIRPEAPPV